MDSTLRKFPLAKLTDVPKKIVYEKIHFARIFEMANASEKLFNDIKNMKFRIEVSVYAGKDWNVSCNWAGHCVTPHFGFMFKKTPEDDEYIEDEEEVSAETPDTRIRKMGTLEVLGRELKGMTPKWLFHVDDPMECSSQLLAHIKHLFQAEKPSFHVHSDHIDDLTRLQSFPVTFNCDSVFIFFDINQNDLIPNNLRRSKITQILAMKEWKKAWIYSFDMPDSFEYNEPICIEDLGIIGNWLKPRHLRNWTFKSGSFSDVSFGTEDFAEVTNDLKTGNLPTTRFIEIILENCDLDLEEFIKLTAANETDESKKEEADNVRTFSVDRNDGSTFIFKISPTVFAVGSPDAANWAKLDLDPDLGP